MGLDAYELLSDDEVAWVLADHPDTMGRSVMLQCLAHEVQAWRSLAALFDMGFHVDGIWRSFTEPHPVTVRIASDLDAEHDTYHNGFGPTALDAITDAVKWAREVVG